jgi:hypothetical protein
MKANAHAARRDGIIFLVLGCLVFLLLGVALESRVPGPMSDFKAVYYGAQAMLQHQDPYAPGVIERLYLRDGNTLPADLILARSVSRAIVVCINLPTGLILLVPFALLSWMPAHLLWISIMVFSVLLAAIVIWKLGAEFEPTLAGALLCLLLINSEVVVIIGNAAGIAISLAVVAAWCFVKDRFAIAGVACLAIGLLLKPHDTGFAWFYFLLAGGLYRKRALQTLAAVVIVAVPAVLWVSHLAPGWAQELHTNIAAITSRGDLSDPGPASMGAHSLGMVVNLQTVFSLILDEPGFYNAATYLVCAPLLLAWAVITMRSRVTPARTLLALASISALTLLPVYHRQYDTKLLLLTIPACVMLYARKTIAGKLALLVNIAAFVITGDLPWAFLVRALSHTDLSTATASGKALYAAVVFPVPLIILITGIFYLWAYRVDARKADDLV